MELSWIKYFLLNYRVVSLGDPCVTYRTLNDTSFRTDSGSLALQSSCGLFPPPPWPQWYRFTATTGGEIATQCPLNSTCGARNQLWINDTLPSYLDGEKNVRTCLKRSSDCCANGKNIVVKNCNGYYVCRPDIVPGCSRFCINSTASISPTVSTTRRDTTVVRSTVSLMTKQINRKYSSTLPPSKHSRIPIMIGSIVGSVTGIAVTVTVSFLLYRKYCKKQDEFKARPACESHYDISKASGTDFVSKMKFKINSIGPQDI